MTDISHWLHDSAYIRRETSTGSNPWGEQLTGSVTGSLFPCHMKHSLKELIDYEGKVINIKSEILVPRLTDILEGDRVYVTSKINKEFTAIAIDDDSCDPGKVVYLR